MEELIECKDCVYEKECPCGYSLHNAACLTIQKKRKPVRKITVYWSKDNEEVYEFDTYEAAQAFAADALRKCGPVTYKWETIDD